MSISPHSVFITGANRGIGLEFVKKILQLANPPKYVIATCRDPDNAKDLQELAKAHSSLSIFKFDVTDFGAIPAIVEKVRQVLDGAGLSLLINNAGVIHRSAFGEVGVDEMRQGFDVNCVAPMMISQAMAPLLRQAAQSSSLPGMSCSKAAIINITSKLGSMDDNKGGGRYAYRASKAGLHAITKNMAIDLAKDDILAAVLHPGWVLTDMGGPNALINTDTCVSGLLNVMAGLDAEKTGTLWDYKGESIKW